MLHDIAAFGEAHYGLGLPLPLRHRHPYSLSVSVISIDGAIHKSCGDPAFPEAHNHLHNVLRFNTTGALFPVWVVRTIQQGPETVPNDSFTLLIRGDFDNPL